MSKKRTRMLKVDKEQKLFDLCNALIMHPCSLKMALKQAGVNKSTYYLWKKEDPWLGQSMEHWKKAEKEFVKGCLLKSIANGSVQAQKFYLETICKDEFNKTKVVEHIDTTKSVLRIETVANPEEWDSLAYKQQEKYTSQKALEAALKRKTFDMENANDAKGSEDV